MRVGVARTNCIIICSGAALKREGFPLLRGTISTLTPDSSTSRRCTYHTPIHLHLRLFLSIPLDGRRSSRFLYLSTAARLPSSAAPPQ